MKKSLLPLFIIAIFWHLLCYLTIVDPAFFPTPLSIFKNTFMLLSRDHLLIQVYYSLKRLIIAFGLSAPLAIVLAMVVAHFKKIDDFINPIVAFTFPLPKVALYPLLLLIFGIDDLSKIALIGVGIFYLIFINLRVGIKSLLNGQANDVVKIYKLDNVNYLWNFLLKGSQLELLTGLKLGLNYGLTLVVVSEFSTSNNGIGYYIWRSWDQFKIINVYSGILVLSLVGFIFYFFFNYLIDRAQKNMII